jgi:hypothetical protein
MAVGLEPVLMDSRVPGEFPDPVQWLAPQGG